MASAEAASSISPTTHNEHHAMIKKIADFLISPEEKSPFDTGELLDFFLDIAANDELALQLSFDPTDKNIRRIGRKNTTAKPAYEETRNERAEKRSVAKSFGRTSNLW